MKDKTLTPSSKIYTAPSHIPKAGRGVFALIDIKKGGSIKPYPMSRTNIRRKYVFSSYGYPA